MSPHSSHAAVPFPARSLLALLLAACVVGVLALMVPHGAEPRRVAIRVECSGAAPCDAGFAMAEKLALDVWTEQRVPGEPLDVVVSEDALPQLTRAAVAFSVIDPDIDATARAETQRIATQGVSGDWFTDYHDYEGIEAHLRELAELAPERASLQSIGTTQDGRAIWALRVGRASDDAVPILINGTQHAREWISAMSATCIADRLVRQYDEDPAIRAFVDGTEAWIVPVVNPDGYSYSWGKDRYWRKNRSGGHGVDLNRNFSVAWGEDGSSGSKRSEIYRGEEPFSEKETIALRALTEREHFKLHVDFHAYGQLVLFPWEHKAKTPAPDRARFAAIGDELVSAIYAKHETRYRLMPGVELYPSAGTMTDWMYGEAGATSFTIELRPRSGTGFVLPPTEIKPTCDEALAAVLALRASRQVP